MKREIRPMPRVSLLTPTSSTFTDANKTGTWSFIQPSYLEKTAPCSEACPCAEDIPRIEMLASRGLFAAAWRAILAENPLPGVCGRVCFRPCEQACNRGELDEAVSINALERFLSDAAAEDGGAEGLEPAKPKGKRVAILGSGPAGLSAAYFLARLGYECELFEAEAEAGGLLRYGIPSYRLPPAELDRELERITRLGVAIHTGGRVDAAFLREAASGYDAVFVACGNALSSRLGIPGEDLAQDALPFLARIRREGEATGKRLAGRRVAIIGGGNGAIDAARSALRLGASPTIVYRRRREDMPAFDEEVREAMAEGVRLLELRSPVSIRRASEGGLALELQAMRPAGKGPDGRERVEALAGSIETLKTDEVFIATGAGPDPAWASAARLSSIALGRCAIDFEGKAPIAYIGDLASGEVPALKESVADAIASGKAAAIALDAFFQGGRDFASREIERCRVGRHDSLSMEVYRNGERERRDRRVVPFSEINADYFGRSPRERGPALPRERAARGFAELRGALGARAALAQASRCFNCGLCNGCDNCRTFCPEVAIVADDKSYGRIVNADYCKGCGICVTECPRSAMILEGERS